MSPAPGVNVNVTAASSSPQNNAPTGNWFVTGVAHGVSGVAVPIYSMADFTTYFGQIVNGVLTGRYSTTVGGVTIDSSLLYDSLDVYFREGGVVAWVSRMVPASSGTAAATSSSAGAFILTAAGVGAWANSSNANASGIILTITNNNGVYGATIALNGNVLAASPGLLTDTEVINWVNSLPVYLSGCTAAAQAHASNLPSNGNSTAYYFTAGVDAAVADSDMTAALAAFTPNLGAGQVSRPGATSGTTYQNLTNHAIANNRIAFLDGASQSGSAEATAVTALTGAVTTLQGAVTDASYAALFYPWVIAPGITNTNPSSTQSLVFQRTVPPSAYAAAKASLSDLGGEANVPAAGVQASRATYVTGLANASSSGPNFTAASRSSLNAGGVSLLRNVPSANTVAIYGYRTCAYDPNWQFLAHARFRMQLVGEFNVVGETYTFREIDANGQLFGAFNGDLSAVCLRHYNRGSLYGVTPSAAFTVNTGQSVNTRATIAAGQINAQVALRFSPTSEQVTINVTKYAANAALPQTL